MRRRIVRPPIPAPSRGKRGRRPGGLPPGCADRESRLQVHLAADDPRLLDKETGKLYRSVLGTGAAARGPFPLPVALQGKGGRIHRRVLHVLHPTERTVSFLEKLALSEAVQVSITVDKSGRGAAPSGLRGGPKRDRSSTS